MLQQKSFQRPLKKAKNEIAIAAPFNYIFLKKFVFLESSGMGFLMRFQFWSCLATFIFGPYVMVGSGYFWLAWLDSPCWGQIEAESKRLGMILSIRVRRKPIWSLVISASVLSWDIKTLVLRAWSSSFRGQKIFLAGPGSYIHGGHL